MCDPTNHESYGQGLKAVTDVHNRVVYMLDDIIVIFQRWLYNILCARGSLMQPPVTKAVSGNVSPMQLLLIAYKYTRTL